MKHVIVCFVASAMHYIPFSCVYGFGLAAPELLPEHHVLPLTMTPKPSLFPPLVLNTLPSLSHTPHTSSPRALNR